MGRVATCFDNAAAESFFATLEKDLLRRRPIFATKAEAKHEIFMYINSYNNTRLHSTLGYHSPAQFEKLPPLQQQSILQRARERAQKRREKVIEIIKRKNSESTQLTEN